ncbi:Do family serine endopeptidase [Prosthecodimorpha staleyi]|uniref:Do family serine endopeptidase n=1 Tax=Prosthecodimorpha staleyi TaxID=2840188 RepID=A0A947GBH5_9HYPH|nr:Do family serine endopeptidase [Prosthecodimorpha staleyi]MBT9288081.1 Do family serine endopeptidase [Prosthecodimorpha staleyi]
MVRAGSFVAALILAVAVSAPAQAQTQTQTRVVPESKAQVQLSFAPIVKRVAPAVVNVYAQRTLRQQGGSPMFDDPLFRRFFGDGPLGMPKDRVESSLGSGVIIDRSGLVVTNHHVIKDATEVKIALSDKREFEADVVLKDDRTDLAVLRIKEKGDYPFAEFGDSDQIEVGDLVLAIGNPFGVGQTVTQGIVSALARTQVGVSDYRFFIQTDAAINPGNSGGALVDMEGRLVGVPTAIYSRSGGSIGIGFAIPGAMVKFVAEQAKTGGSLRRPWFGATLQNVTPDMAEALGIKRPVGTLVAGMSAKGPAANAGLKVGDLLVAIDGFEIDDLDGFGYRYSTRPIGGTAKISIIRQGKPMTVEVGLVAAPETVPRDERMIRAISPFQGAVVANLSPAVAEELRVPNALEGVVVKSVETGALAGRFVQKGDVILEVNGTKIDSTKTLEKVTQSDPGSWRVAVQRGGEVVRFAVRS